MTKTCKVQFRPKDTTVEVPQGTTLLAAANQAGVFVNSLCGGDGVCGRCRVIVRKGKAVGGTTEFFTREEIQRGYFLACQARVETDLVVDVPPETRQAAGPKHAVEQVPFLAELSKAVGREIEVNPLVRKSFLQLKPPTLEDNIADLARLEHALGRTMPGREFQMGLKVTRRLPHVLRRSDWKVTAVTAHRGALTEIIDVEAGDTTRRNFCIAADIGTTTIVCHLVDLQDGQTLGRAAKYNSQAAYGADFIRRIIHASGSEAGENTLRQAVVGDVNELIKQLTTKYRLGTGDITVIAAAGNTAMMHLMLGLPAENIRKAPYTGVAYDLPPFRAAEIGLQINPRGLLYCVPCVAGFVGGDVVAGIFSTGLARGEAVRMLIDIGTNGEIAIGNSEFIVTASASAGPAFEGAECRSGMRATDGAIDHIRLLDARSILNFSTIGSSPPVGLCGTGYVDLVAEMLRVGAIDKTGRLNPRAAVDRIREGQYGEMEYVIVPAAQSGNGKDIAVTQGDIDNIRRAKGAIFAACRVLLKALNMTFDDVSEILVAGAFGNFLNVANAVFIGLLPDLALDRLKFVGNTSIAGAKLAAICSGAYDEMSQIAARTTYFELSTDPTFMDEFVSACFFPHTHVELFPKVMAELAGRKAVPT
ncbi:MAG: ASKHA domain-containing protein [Phycisphaerae bacterium]